jgi:hypothetical protein
LTYCIFKALFPDIDVLLLPVFLEISHLDTGIQDRANEVDTTVVKDSVPLAKIVKASLECGDNLHIL